MSKEETESTYQISTLGHLLKIDHPNHWKDLFDHKQYDKVSPILSI